MNFIDHRPASACMIMTFHIRIQCCFCYYWCDQLIVIKGNTKSVKMLNFQRYKHLHVSLATRDAMAWWQWFRARNFWLAHTISLLFGRVKHPVDWKIMKIKNCEHLSFSGIFNDFLPLDQPDRQNQLDNLINSWHLNVCFCHRTPCFFHGSLLNNHPLWWPKQLISTQPWIS